MVGNSATPVTASATQQVDAGHTAARATGRQALWLLLYPLSLCLNLRTVFGVFRDEGVFPLGTDSYYHLRRILAAVEHFPRVPNLETYLSFPEPAVVAWPFGFDVLYAAFVLVCTGGQPDTWWVMALSPLLTPLLAAFVPCFLALMGKELGSPRAGFWAGLLFCLLPTAYTQVGYIDHHVLEPFWAALYLLFYLRAARLAESDPARASRAAVLSGLALAAGLLCTTILPLLIPVHATVLAAQIVRVWRARGSKDALLAINSTLFLTLTATLLPFVATRIAEPAGLNPALQASWYAAFTLAGACLVGVARGGRTRPAAAAGVWAAMGVAGLATAGIAPALEFALYGVKHVFTHDPWLASIAESHGLVRIGPEAVLRSFSGLLLLWPVALVVALRRGWKEGGGLWPLAVFAAVLTIPAIAQLKFRLLFDVPYTIVCGLLWVEALERLGRVEPASRLARLGPRNRLAIAALLVLLLLTPSLKALAFTSPFVLPGKFEPLYAPLLWLRHHTPPTSEAGTSPDDYGVVGHWQVGHWVVAFSKRPVVGSPLGLTGPLRDGIRDASGILLRPPDEAVELMERRRARYVILTTEFDTLAELAYWDPAGGGYPQGFDPKSVPPASFTRGLLMDAVPARQDRPDVYRHVRFVYESAAATRLPEHTVEYVAIFERVPGARIQGLAAPGAPVEIFARVRTSGGREFSYLDEVEAGPDGRFSVTVPYAEGPQRYSACGLAGPYELRSDGRTVPVRVSESDVLVGAPVLAATLE